MRRIAPGKPADAPGPLLGPLHWRPPPPEGRFCAAGSDYSITSSADARRRAPGRSEQLFTGHGLVVAGTQAAAVAETEQNADLEVLGDGQQSPGLIRTHYLRNLLRLTQVIDLAGKIQSPQRHAKQEPQSGHDLVCGYRCSSRPRPDATGTGARPRP